MDDKIFNIINAFRPNLAHVKCDVCIKIEFPEDKELLLMGDLNCDVTKFLPDAHMRRLISVTQLPT